MGWLQTWPSNIMSLKKGLSLTFIDIHASYLARSAIVHFMGPLIMLTIQRRVVFSNYGDDHNMNSKHAVCKSTIEYILCYKMSELKVQCSYDVLYHHRGVITVIFLDIWLLMHKPTYKLASCLNNFSLILEYCAPHSFRRVVTEQARCNECIKYLYAINTPPEF